MPPIVGVPRLVWCDCGPSSRMNWPQPRRLNSRMKSGVRKSVKTSETPPATRSGDHAVALARVGRRGSGAPPTSTTSRARRLPAGVPHAADRMPASISATSTDSPSHEPSRPAARWMWRARSPTTTSLRDVEAHRRAGRCGRAPPAAYSPSSAISPSTATERCPGGDDLREGLQGGRRRIGAGVVGVVDDRRRRSRGSSTSMRQRSARGTRLDRGDRARRAAMPSSRATARAARAFDDVVLAEDAQVRPGGARPSATRVNGCRSARRLDVLGAEVGSRVESERDDARRGPRGHRRHPRSRRRSARRRGRGQLGRPSRPWRAAVPLDAAELAGVGEADLEHDADVGARDRDQPGDLADAARAHLDDEVPGVRRRCAASRSGRRRGC